MSTFAKKVTSAVLTSAIVLTTAGSTAGVSAALMNDVDAANALAAAMVIEDKSSNPSAYRLNDTIQRKEALKVMIKLSDKVASEGSCTSPFADIADSDWACKYAVAALDAGFIAANDNFRPDDKVSKIEALKMVMQARGIAKDANTEDWRAAYVKAGVEAGVAETFSDYDTSSTRGVMFTWAAEAINQVEEDVDFDLGSLLGDDIMADDTTDEEATTDETTDTITVSGDDELVVSLNPETPADGLAQADTDRTTLLVFDVKAGSEDVTLKNLTLNFIGLGDYRNLDNVALYNSIGEKVSKTKNFTEVEREISFDNDVVVEAGTTMTLTIAGKITSDGTENATYGVKLVDIEASSDVEGEDLVGALLVPAVFSTVAKLEISDDTANQDVVIGEEVKLAGFSIEEKNDNEDVIIKTITLEQTGSVDADDFGELSLYIEGEKVASDLTLNSDDELVVPLDYELAADTEIDVEVRGVLKSGVGETIEFTLPTDGIYAIGKTSNMVTAVEAFTTNDSVDIAEAKTIEGSEINVSFDRSDIDEAAPAAEEVKVGTLNIASTGGEYTLEEITVEVESLSNSGVLEILDKIELDGKEEDEVVSDNDQDKTVTFKWTDITLNANDSLSYDLTFDVLEEAKKDEQLKFEVKITEVHDEEDDVDYTTSNMDEVLSATTYNTKTIDIDTASMKLVKTTVVDRELVLANGVETVLFKGKLSTGDAGSVEIKDIKFDRAGVSTYTWDLDDIIESATLNIGGQTFDADIDADSIDFTDNVVIAANSDDIVVLLTAVLKDKDGATGTIAIKVAEATLKDSENNTVLESTNDNGDKINDDVVTGEISTTTTLRDKGTMLVKVIQNGDNEDAFEDVVLAGTDSVVLAEVELQAEYEDIKIKNLQFATTGSGFAEAYSNVRIEDGEGNVLVDEGDVSASGSQTIITFDEDQVLANTTNSIDAILVADVSTYSTEGDEDAGYVGTGSIFALYNTGSFDFEGKESGDDITDITDSGTATGEELAIVPALVSIAVTDRLGTDDKYAKIRFTIDKGNNHFDDDDVIVNSIEIETAVSGSGVIVRNDDNVTVVNGDTDTILNLDDATEADYKLNNDDEFEFKVSEDNAEIRIVKKGITYTLDGSEYNTNNDSILDLGEYNESN